jgi:hypothetical protein
MSLFRHRTSLERAKHRRGLVRVAAYMSFGTLVFGALGVRQARAEYRHEALRFGRQMVELARSSNQQVTKIVMNGQPLHVGSAVTLDSPEAVLERYDEYCKANGGQTDDFKDIEKALRKQTPGSDGANATAIDAKDSDTSALARAGHVRTGGKDDGAVICFVRGAQTKSTSREAFESFVTTGDLGAFGELRYAYASKRGEKTLVLTVWTDSSFNLGSMTSDADHDSPGEDFPELPRPPNSVRVMSAHADGAPYGVNIYRTTDAPTQTLERFDHEMKEMGWFTYDPELSEEEHKGLGRAYMKNAVVVTVGTSRLADGNYVAVGLAGVSADDTLGRR